ncbi:hypothetical protein TRFO_20829 [Tritrichomonas foetus]|uniref:Uncharacterized protein n=1 Tax=Tritrichomonas foetus TaxID=1144522 RepID=A0A1J4KFN2_9EUKA|nr:hypothetical protein TRFO_20829 [Tritrichomonas foetus]|eukprot:OHT10027.1 hypothetical protein TRFO_20829 [Tritrichomonas foetus]
MSSKKKPRSISAKGKKGVDETEKLASGNGWTTAAVQKYLEATTDEERLNQLLAMFSITEQEYQYDFKSTATIDFHFANVLYCTEANFDPHKIQFFCRTLHKMLETGIQKIQENSELDFDELRDELYEMFHVAFNEFNTPEYLFTPPEATELIKHVTLTFLRPIRLILHPYYLENHSTYLLELKKVFRPVKPVPLSECEEIMPVIDEDKQFPILTMPKEGTIDLEGVRQAIKQYTDGIIQTIEKRYDDLDEQIARLNPMMSPT